jgi:hypothetical protein
LFNGESRGGDLPLVGNSTHIPPSGSNSKKNAEENTLLKISIEKIENKIEILIT